MSEIMLDLETLSVRPNAVIVVIGAIKFNRYDELPEKIDEKCLRNLNTFYERVHIESCQELGMCIDDATLSWWEAQDKDAKHEALQNPKRLPLKTALAKFSKWFGTESYTKIWGNGSSFDCTILGEAYKRCNMTPPWKFWMERDLRTILDIGRIRVSDLPQYKKHHALYDCYRQIIGFQRAFKNIRGRV